MQQLLLKRRRTAKVDIPRRADQPVLVDRPARLQVWQTLGVDPKMLADSAKSTAEKERLAATRVDAYLDKMMAGTAQRSASRRRSRRCSKRSTNRR